MVTEEAAHGAEVGILDLRVVTQSGGASPGFEALLSTLRRFALEEKRQPLPMLQARATCTVVTTPRRKNNDLIHSSQGGSRRRHTARLALSPWIGGHAMGERDTDGGASPGEWRSCRVAPADAAGRMM